MGSRIDTATATQADSPRRRMPQRSKGTSPSRRPVSSSGSGAPSTTLAPVGSAGVMAWFARSAIGADGRHGPTDWRSGVHQPGGPTCPAPSISAREHRRLMWGIKELTPIRLDHGGKCLGCYKCWRTVRWPTSAPSRRPVAPWRGAAAGGVADWDTLMPPCDGR